MSKLIGQCEIDNVHSNKKELASIYEGVSSQHIQDFEKLWLPEFHKKEQLLREAYSDGNGTLTDEDGYNNQIEHYRMQDWQWDWKAVSNKVSKYDIYNIFSLACDDTLQGIICTNTDEHQCRLKSQKGKAVVYIEGIAIAPWNRYPWFDPRKYKYIGETLIGTAISLSIESGFEGRICLHSLSQADTWYVDILGMTKHDCDTNDLNWYEMTSDDAQILLSNSSSREVSI